MLEDPLIARLKELTMITHPTQKEFEELEQIKKELEIIDEDREQSEPIPELSNHRKQQEENRLKEQELRRLVQERKALEVRMNIRKEKERIQMLKAEMDRPRIKKEWCVDCKRYEDQYGNPLK